MLTDHKSNIAQIYPLSLHDALPILSKDRMPNARNRETRQQQQIEEALVSGRSVVIDNTNPSIESRAPLIALGHRHGARDRKSTRLNSSHRCISYAVFCLKKKKKTCENRDLRRQRSFAAVWSARPALDTGKISEDRTLSRRPSGIADGLTNHGAETEARGQ